jgi:hypothetical protein
MLHSQVFTNEGFLHLTLPQALQVAAAQRPAVASPLSHSRRSRAALSTVLIRNRVCVLTACLLAHACFCARLTRLAYAYPYALVWLACLDCFRPTTRAAIVWRSLRCAAAAQRRVRRPRRTVGDRAEGHRHNHQPLLHVAGAPAPCHACAGTGPTPLTTALRRSLPHPLGAARVRSHAHARLGKAVRACAHQSSCGRCRFLASTKALSTSRRAALPSSPIPHHASATACACTARAPGYHSCGYQ